MNGQQQPPQSWEEWVTALEKAIRQNEMNIALLKGQLKVARHYAGEPVKPEPPAQ